uniref:ribose-phosphate diphosphokinase n=3 Tax=Thermofilum pendens TaxID=2269 RepID=A0A7J3X5B0_THEPE
MDALLLAGEWCSELARKLSEQVGLPYHALITRKFPDGETYLRVPVGVAGRDVVLLICAGRRPNDALVEAVFSSVTLKRLGAGSVTLAMPYFPYARQDSEFQRGEAVSLAIVSKMLEDSGVDSIVTVDMHLHRFKSVSEVFSIPAYNVSVMPDLADYVRKTCGDCLVVAPDGEAEQWARVFSERLGTGYVVFEKKRLGDYYVEVRGALQGAERVVIVDDIISTGSTIATVAQALTASGAKEIIVACAHALLTDGAEARILGAGVKEIVASDTVVNPFMKVSAARALGEGVLRAIRGAR